MKRGRKPDTIFITLLKGSAQCVVDRTDALVESVSAERTREPRSDLDDIEHRVGVNTASPEVAIDQCEIVAKQIERIPEYEKMIPVPRMW